MKPLDFVIFKHIYDYYYYHNLFLNNSTANPSRLSIEEGGKGKTQKMQFLFQVQYTQI